LERHIVSFLDALRTVPVSVVLVSNEVGSGVVPPYPLGRKYRDVLGELNQRVAAIADNVVLMVAGLPLALKGSIEARP
jgi:adenosylcobinamide kinase/adenosylcobinamide-phosphate guanylyltransferase